MIPLLGLTLALLENDAMIAMLGLYVATRLAPRLRAISGQKDALEWEEFYRNQRSGFWLMALGRYSLTGVSALALIGAFVLSRFPLNGLSLSEWLLVVVVVLQLVVATLALTKCRRLRAHGILAG